MQLYVVRHGPAGDSFEWEGPDQERPLTPRGKQVVRRVGGRLGELGIAPDAILTSPYVRAAQTAEILAQALDRTDRLATDARLAAGFGTADLMSLLADYDRAHVLMIVGHEPDLGEAVCELTGAERIRMKKGAVARVDLADPHTSRGELQWLAPPKVLAGAMHEERAAVLE